jgi:hypothetical protein
VIAVLVALATFTTSLLTADLAPITFSPHPFSPADQETIDTWIEHDLGDGCIDLNLEVHALDAERAFLHGSLDAPWGTIRTVLLRTQDGGATWCEALPPVVGSAVTDLAFAGDGSAWVLALWQVEGPGTVLLYGSEDSGETWERRSEVPKRKFYGTPMRLDLSTHGRGTVELLYDTGSEDDGVELLGTRDGGRTWTVVGASAEWWYLPRREAQALHRGDWELRASGAGPVRVFRAGKLAAELPRTWWIDADGAIVPCSEDGKRGL